MLAEEVPESLDNRIFTLEELVQKENHSQEHPTDIYFFPIDIFKSIGDDLSSVYAVDNC